MARLHLLLDGLSGTFYSHRCFFLTSFVSSDVDGCVHNFSAFEWTGATAWSSLSHGGDSESTAAILGLDGCSLVELEGR